MARLFLHTNAAGEKRKSRSAEIYHAISGAQFTGKYAQFVHVNCV